MILISIGTDRKLFETGSNVWNRQIEYASFLDELHIIVFATKNKKFGSKIKITDNVFVYPTNSKNKLFYVWDAFFIAKNIISKLKKENILISTQDPFETGVVGLFLKLFFAIPLQIQLHTDFYNKYFLLHSPLNFVRFLLAQITIPFADGVRCVSAKVAKGLRELNSNICILPISQNIKTTDVVHQKKFRGKILTVCRLEKEKDIKTAIKAFAKLSLFYPEATFTIVGDGGERGSLEKLTKSLNLDSKINFVGWQNDLDSFYKEADIYISTSIFEGYGMSVVEAALYGLPLVLSDAGIAREYFKDNGALLCKPGAVDDFFNSLMSLFKDSEKREQLGLRSRESSIAKLITKEKYLDIYKENLENILKSKINKNFYLRVLSFFLVFINSNRVIRFVIAGSSVAITQIGLLYLLTEFLGFWYLISSLFSFIYALITSFLLQKYWAFKDNNKKNATLQFFKFVLVAIIGIFINIISMYFWVDIVGVWYVIGQFITGLIIALINFLIYKFFIFKKIK